MVLFFSLKVWLVKFSSGVAYFLQLSSEENESLHMWLGNSAQRRMSMESKWICQCILMTYALWTQTATQGSAGVKTVHVDAAPHMQARQTMPAVDCLLWPPYGQWLTDSISLLSHFPLLLLIRYPVAWQIKMWQRWLSAKGDAAPGYEKHWNSILSQDKHSLMATTRYWFHPLVLEGAWPPLGRTFKCRKYGGTEASPNGRDGKRFNFVRAKTYVCL